MHDEILFAEKAVRAGALGYLNKQATADQILKAIYRVLDGKAYLSPAITERTICGSIRLSPLTDRMGLCRPGEPARLGFEPACRGAAGQTD